MKRIASLLFALSIVMASFVCTSAESRTNPVTKRAILMMSPRDHVIHDDELEVMEDAFNALNIPYTLYVNNDREISSFFEAITTAFSDADSNDINYIVTSSHGLPSGELQVCGPNPVYDTLTPAQFKSGLDNIPGNFVLMINACFSGNCVERGNESQESRLDYGQVFIENFFSTNRSGELAGSQKYTVFCSSTSIETSNYSILYGAAAALQAWSEAMTINGRYFEADSDYDGVVTGKEFFDYSKPRSLEIMQEDHDYLYPDDELRQPHMVAYVHNKMTSVFYNDKPLGDVSGDYLVTTVDKTKITSYIAGTETFSSSQLKLADVNEDGYVNFKDALEIGKYLAGTSSLGLLT